MCRIRRAAADICTVPMMSLPLRQRDPTSPPPRRHGGAPVAGLLVFAAVLGVAAIQGGCARSIVTDPVPTAYDRTDPAAEVVFFHNLASSSRVSNDEALHALMLLALDEDPTTTYEDRVAAAKAAGWLNASFDEPADLVVRKGLVAESLVRMLRIDNSVMLGIFGPTGRYAVRELIALGIMPVESTERQAMSGAELVGILGRARDHAIMEKMRELRKSRE